MPKNKLNICHLYGNLMNTYGDNGNILMLKYLSQKMQIEVQSEVVSIYEPFEPEKYNFVFFGGGQDFEQKIISEDIQKKKTSLVNYIENNGVLLAICGGYQLLGHYYIGANGEKIDGIGALDYYTLSQENNRYIGDIEIYNEEFNETYYGFENHNGRTFLGENLHPLGKTKKGNGNNAEDGTEGVHYKNVFCSYFHGPILARNENLGIRLIHQALAN
ncbi:adenosylcobyric acid synthase [Melissococcus plutonius]|uniref:Lipid II isoglutaminyl synthase (glutamine-hydrolyzing) subunit GatD n=1 Tax=Melissococcus plutonius TaxID=33970 RepID=A0A2Z5Y177_9ENTE|nr:glutamine amidotransferase [Melissococcus plutonius]BAL61767.1 putative amidotransferase [Melissococcus plutonius DAT561]MCV2498286.1 adenosylcobyric acid synthase [Melissococcus plutonius]MCV2500849.1 adenosylcobyric acid synthase [Melissococcus plutonius]MCV2504603.1 adenosylcobyric acid synthase [Melissococcus plutonius]MCV2506901.1 adenosylcobyric acid synthase [Melissococcus plutonius]